MNLDDFVEILLENTIDTTKEYQALQILPYGKVWIEKRNQYLVLDNELFEELIKSFNDPAIPEMTLDKNHKLEENYGTFKNMRIEETGLVADIKFNDAGKKLIKLEKYKYISPLFGRYVDTQKVTHKWAMTAVTLTNIPALGGLLPTIQSQVELELFKKSQVEQVELELFKKSQKKQEGKNMNMIALELGLNPEANDNIILEAVRAEKAKNIELTKENVKLASERNAVEKELTNLNAKIMLENAERNKKNAEVIVLEAIKLGKIMPTQKDIYIKRFCRSDEERQEVELEFKMLPEKKSGGETVSFNTDDGLKLTDEQRRAVKKFEIDTKDKVALENFLNELEGGE